MGSLKKKAFVLMPFSSPFNSYYPKIFKPALEAVGYDVTRADDLFTPRPIISDIQKSILEADLILCEMSTRNANVFYELGLAHAIGKPAILISLKEENIPFDLRHLRVILYDYTQAGWEDKLREGIKSAAQAVLTSDEIWPPLLLTPNIKLFTNQADATTDIIATIEREKPKTASFLMYSSSQIGTVLEKLIGSKVCDKISILLHSPQSAIPSQRRRIHDSIRYLKTYLESYLKANSRNQAKIRCYDEPASLRGVKLGDKWIIIGWYIHYRDRKREALRISGHSNPLIGALVASKEGRILCERFDKTFNNLWEKGVTLKEICGICRKKGGCLGIGADEWLAVISQE